MGCEILSPYGEGARTCLDRLQQDDEEAEQEEALPAHDGGRCLGAATRPSAGRALRRHRPPCCCSAAVSDPRRHPAAGLRAGRPGAGKSAEGLSRPQSGAPLRSGERKRGAFTSSEPGETSAAAAAAVKSVPLPGGTRLISLHRCPLRNT